MNRDHELVDVPAHEAIVLLAQRVAEAYGIGAWNDDMSDTEGELDGPVSISTAAVLGEQRAFSVLRDGGVRVWVDEDLAPAPQLLAILEQIEGHCISKHHRI